MPCAPFHEDATSLGAETGRGRNGARWAVRTVLAELSAKGPPEGAAPGSGAVHTTCASEALESAGGDLEHGQRASQRLVLKVLPRQ